MATIITRQTTAASITPANAGVTSKGAPLTNAELDTNLIQLNYGITSNAAITGGSINNVGSLSATYSNITLPSTGGGSVFVIDNSDLSTSSNSSMLYRGYDAGGGIRHGAAITWGKSGAWTAGGGNYGSYLSFSTRADGTDTLEKMRITAAGNVGIGTTSPISKLSVYSTSAAGISSIGDGTGAGINVYRYSNDTAANTFASQKARGTYAVPLAVSSGDLTATFSGLAYGGSNFRAIGSMSAFVDTYTSDTNISGFLSFSTNSGSTSTTERMRITSAGGISFGNTGTAYGSLGQVLTSAGNAPPTWSPLPISSQWTTTGSDIYYTTGSVGIGTTTPASYGKFAVVGTAGQLFTVTDSLTGTIFSANDVSGIPSIEVLDTGVVKLAQYSGNVGIGTASPAYKLDVTGTAKISGATIIGGTPPAAGQLSIVGANAGISLALSDNVNSSLYIRHLGGGSLLGTDGGNSLRFATGGNTATEERMRIDSSGNVGVGTTNPAGYKFRIVGTSGTSQFRAGTDANGYLEINAFDSNPVYCTIAGANATSGVFGTQSNIPTIFFTNNTEKMRIHALGGVSINNTSDPGAGNLTVTGKISDSKGDVRAAPIQTKVAAYIVVAADAGQTIYISTGGVTINASILSAGDMITIVNASATAQTITAGASVTFRLAGTATTGNRTLAQRGMATFLCVVGGATPDFYCSGAGLS